MGKSHSILSDGIHIPPKLCQFTFEHFDGVFKALIENPETTHKEAYEVLEKGHEEIFGHRRYSSYESFRQVRNRNIKKG